ILAWTAWRTRRSTGATSGQPTLSTAKGQKLYTAGIDRLRVLDYVGARDLLEGALAAEPGSADVRGALAEARAGLGYSGKARVLAREALEGAAPGPSIQRTRLEGLQRKLTGDLPKADALFQEAFAASHSVEDALDLSSVQPAGDAFETLSTFRK